MLCDKVKFQMLYKVWILVDFQFVILHVMIHLIKISILLN